MKPTNTSGQVVLEQSIPDDCHSIDLGPALLETASQEERERLREHNDFITKVLPFHVPTRETCVDRSSSPFWSAKLISRLKMNANQKQREGERRRGVTQMLGWKNKGKKK